jgi:hypothetical protein
MSAAPFLTCVNRLASDAIMIGRFETLGYDLERVP